ncbi:MAG: universal stress protein [Paludibacter sp.]|nr:universal stress protein [Paludibacter sp.]
MNTLKFEKLLVCLDLTEMDDYLMRYARFLADTFQSTVVKFIHVMDSYEYPEELSELFSDDKVNSLKESITEDLSERMNALFDGSAVQPELVLEEGHTIEHIVRHADKNKIDLTVLGKKIDFEGKGGVGKKIIGLIPGTVLLVTETSPLHFNKILVRTNFAQPSVVALQAAAYLKEQGAAESYELHHVYKLPYNYFPVVDSKNMQKVKARLSPVIEKSYRRFIEKFKVSTDIPFAFSVNAKGDEAQSIYDYAKKNSFDLVISGTSMKSSFAMLITDSVSEKLADEDKNVPLMIVKDQKKFTSFFSALFN